MSYYTKSSHKVDEKLIAKARQFLELFYNREDKVPVAPHRDWEKSSPVLPVEPTNLEEALLGHLFGQGVAYPSFKSYGKKLHGAVRLGSYSIAPDNTCIWACVDLDVAGGKHKFPLKDPDAAALLILNRIKAYGVPAYLVRSGGGFGWHVWVFLDAPIHASILRKFLHDAVPDNIPLRDGGFADRKAKGVEIFPKQDWIDEKEGSGNLVWLPSYHGHRKRGGAGRFHEYTEFAIGDAYSPETFELASATLIHEIVASLPSEAAPKVSVVESMATSLSAEELGAIQNAEIPTPEVVERAIEYLKSAPPAIEGQNGDATTFKTMCNLVRGFNLPTNQAFDLAWRYYNPRCVPAWSEQGLRSKVNSAEKNGKFERGYLLKEGAKPWQEPKPLPQKLKPLPAPLKEMFPPVLGEYAWDCSKRLDHAPVELVFGPLICLLGGVLGRSLGIHPKRKDPWTVIANLWGANVAPPSEKKSPSFELAKRPLEVLKQEAKEIFEKEKVRNAARLRAHQLDVERVEKEIKEAQKKGESSVVESLIEQLTDLKLKEATLKVTQKRYTTNDASVPAIQTLILDNRRGLVAPQDELTQWLYSLDRKGSETDRSFFLTAWNGNSRFEGDRLSRGYFDIDGLCLSVFGNIPPRPFEKYVSDSLRGTTGDDGLVQRLQVLFYPDHQNIPRLTDLAADKDAAREIERVFRYFDNINPGDWIETDENTESDALKLKSDVVAIHFDDQAQALRDAWAYEKAVKEKQYNHICPAFAAHIGKYDKIMAGLALIFHLVECARSGKVVKRVSIGATRLAAAWCDLLLLHAEKIYAPALRGEVLAAYDMAEKIKSRVLRDKIALGDVHGANWKGLDSAKSARQAAEYLEALGWLRLEDVKTDKPGRPSTVIRLNPILFGEDGRVKDELFVPSVEAPIFQSKWLNWTPSGQAPVSASVGNVVQLDAHRPEPTPQPRDLNAELIAAVKRMDLKAVEVLVEAGADPNGYAGADTPERETPICFAIRSGCLPMVQLLDSLGANILGVHRYADNPWVDLNEQVIRWIDDQAMEAVAELL